MSAKPLYARLTPRRIAEDDTCARCGKPLHDGDRAYVSMAGFTYCTRTCANHDTVDLTRQTVAGLNWNARRLVLARSE